jgi:hypothetical protein
MNVSHVVRQTEETTPWAALQHEQHRHPAVNNKQLKRGRITLRVCLSSLGYNANFSDSTSKKELINGNPKALGRNREACRSVQIPFSNVWCVRGKTKTKNTPWSESASELYQPSDRRLSAKWLPTFEDRGCHVVSVTDSYGRILGLVDRSRYFSIK